MRERRRLETKINRIFFVGNKVLNIFYLTIFSKKTIFSKITGKKNFWGHDHFWGNGASDDKNEYNLISGKCHTESCFEVFSSEKPKSAEWNRKTGFKETFSPISVVLLSQFFPKTIRFTQTRTNHVNFMKISSKLACILHSYLYLIKKFCQAR